MWRESVGLSRWCRLSHDDIILPEDMQDDTDIDPFLYAACSGTAGAHSELVYTSVY